ncbi:uncharacterized protein M8220_007098 [Acridotheres tristis]
MTVGQGGGGGNNGTGSGTGPAPGSNGTGSGTGPAPGSGAAGLGIPAHLTLSFSSGPHWGAAALLQSHTVRSLERALEEEGSSGILCLSGRKLRDFPGSGCDLSDTTQAGHLTRGYENLLREHCEHGRACQENTLKLSQLAKETRIAVHGLDMMVLRKICICKPWISFI